MQYMLLIYADEQAWTYDERQDCYAESAEFAQELARNGKYLSAAPLHPVSTATSVQIREGKRLITDGPFAETHEQLGGFFLIDALNLDDAIEIAGHLPGARRGTVEIRPVLQVSGLPDK